MSRRIRRHLTALSVAALLYSVLALVARTFPLPNIAALLIAVGTPFVPFVALAALVTSLTLRRVVLSFVAVGVLATALAVQLPWYYLGHPVEVGRHTEITVLSSNLRKGRADPDFIVGLARERADVIAVSELTPEEVTQFVRAGIDDKFPYSVLKPKPGAAGIGLWSRYPLTPVPARARSTTMAAARLEVPGVPVKPLVAGVHLINPTGFDFTAFSEWRMAILGTKTQLAQFAEQAGAGAVIVAGDFNATPDMRQFRDLLTGGYRDAVQQTRAGFAPTFPNNNWVPPVITIDHMLTRNAAASSVNTVRIPGSDHRALLATIKIPLDPTAS